MYLRHRLVKDWKKAPKVNTDHTKLDYEQMMEGASRYQRSFYTDGVKVEVKANTLPKRSGEANQDQAGMVASQHSLLANQVSRDMFNLAMRVRKPIEQRLAEEKAYLLYYVAGIRDRVKRITIVWPKKHDLPDDNERQKIIDIKYKIAAYSKPA